MKHQRLEHKVFIEALFESGLAKRDVLQHVFEQAIAKNELVSEILVREDLLSDYELAAVACRAFGLPYVRVFDYVPDKDASRGLDPNFLRAYGLVPLDRFGTTLTIAMPAMVPSAVLEVLISDEIATVLPVVGSVIANREWLEQNLAPREEAPAAPTPVAEPAVRPEASMHVEEVEGALPTGVTQKDQEEMDEWAAIFDAGDEAVHFSLQSDDQAPEDVPPQSR